LEECKNNTASSVYDTFWPMTREFMCLTNYTLEICPVANSCANTSNIYLVVRDTRVLLVHCVKSILHEHPQAPAFVVYTTILREESEDYLLHNAQTDRAFQSHVTPERRKYISSKNFEKKKTELVLGLYLLRDTTTPISNQSQYIWYQGCIT
ncbi:hypothetical protein THRCLA_07814, partial [Thraustotheca clavata]